MSVEGVDYSSGRPGGAALAAAGIVFACRYLEYRGNPNPRKPLTLGEIDDLHNHGVAVVAAFESTANRALDGRAAGAADGADAAAALKGLGFPASCPAYFAVDFDPQPQYLDRIDAYFEGIATSLSIARIGVYGGYGLLGHLRTGGYATWFWQAAGWSGGHEFAPGHIHQYQTGSMGAKPINGAAVDYDRALKSNFGQWAVSGAGPAQPLPQPENPVLAISAQTPGTCQLIAGKQLYDLNQKPLTTVSVSQFVLSPFASGIYRAIEVTTGGSLQLVLVKASDAPFTPASSVDCSQAVQDAITADRATAYVAYRGKP